MDKFCSPRRHEGHEDLESFSDNDFLKLRVLRNLRGKNCLFFLIAARPR